MLRRDVLRRTATASVIALGGAGVVSANGPTHVRWEFEDGREAVIPLSEFEARSDTPAIEDVEGPGGQSDYDCCVCEDVTFCHPCFERPEC